MRKFLTMMLVMLLLIPSLGVTVQADPDTALFEQADVPSVRGLAYSNGYIYAAQRGRGVVRISTSSGQVTPVISDPRDYTSVTVDSFGNLIFNFEGSRKIYKIPANTLLDLPLTEADVEVNKQLFASTESPSIYSIAMDADNNLYYSVSVTDSSSGRDTSTIYKRTYDGELELESVVLTSTTKQFSGLSFSPSGDLYVMTRYSQNLYQLPKDQLNGATLPDTQLQLVTHVAGENAWGVTAVPSGQVYYSDVDAQAVKRLSLAQQDTVKPVITLNGFPHVTLTKGNEFTDGGASVQDNVDTNLSVTTTYTKDEQSVTGVDTTSPGTTYIHYNAADKAGNPADEVTRTVTVMNPAASFSSTNNIRNPRGLFYQNGSIYVAGRQSGIFQIEPNEAPVVTPIVTIAPDSPVKFKFITVALNKRGDLFYTLDSDAHIYRITKENMTQLPLSQGTSVDSSILTDSFRIYGMTIDSEDNIYYTSQSPNRILKLAPGSSEPVIVAESETLEFSSLSFGPYGDLYFADSNTSKIYKIAKDKLTQLPVLTTDVKFEYRVNNDDVLGLTFLPTGWAYYSGEIGVSRLDLAEYVPASVPDPVPVSGVTLSSSTLNLTVGGGTSTLLATVAPANATNPTVQWTSSNTSVATVVDGVVTPVGPGTADIKVTTVDGSFTASCTVTVTSANGGTPSGGESSGGGSGSTSGSVSSGTSANPSTTEQITVVVDGRSNNNVANASLTRTTDVNGLKKDSISFSPQQAQTSVSSLIAAGQDTARIVIPDTKDEVSQIDVSLPKDTGKALSDGKINLEISTANAHAVIPYTSLNGTDDLYFRFIPIKKAEERLVVENRAKQEPIVKAALGSGNLEVVGRPMTIETNLSSRPVDLILPLQETQILQNPEEQKKWLSNLAIFIEHSDGQRVLVAPTLTEYGTGQRGLKFTVNKFSTFTVVHMDNWSAYNNPHKGYIQGYPDGTFGPEHGLTRAELAVLLSRVYTGTKNTKAVHPFKDLSAKHFAYDAIMQDQADGLMQGIGGGLFAPDQIMTRAEMAVVISRWKGLAGTDTSSAADIKGHWAENEINQVTRAGFMVGMTDGTFKPDQVLTRAEAVVILNRMLSVNLDSSSSIPSRFSDVPASHWALKDIVASTITLPDGSSN